MLRSRARWRRAVFKRDGGCLLCFPRPAPDLTVHHIIPRALCRHHDLIEELDRLSDDLDWLRLYFRRYSR